MLGMHAIRLEVNEESATGELRTSQQRYLQIQCIIGQYNINVNLEMPSSLTMKDKVLKGLPSNCCRRGLKMGPHSLDSD